MATMRPAGAAWLLPPHAHVHVEMSEYVVELDVSDFTERELCVELVGRRVTVRGDQVDGGPENAEPFHLHEQLEEWFRLPDDVDADAISVLFRHGTLEIHAPRTRLESRRLRIERSSNRVSGSATPC
jgi:HSP20 family molecular chaperone IbpA